MDREVTGEMKCIFLQGIDERFLQINACQKIGSMAGLPFGLLHAAMQHDAGDPPTALCLLRAQSDLFSALLYSNS